MKVKIYCIQQGKSGPVKIGLTKGDPQHRLRQLQTGNPNQLHLIAAFTGEPKCEAIIHEFFADDRMKGEWFSNQACIIESFKCLAEFSGGLPTIPPITVGGQEELRFAHKTGDFRKTYPDGLRHAEIDWDELHIMVEEGLAELDEIERQISEMESEIVTY